MRKSTIQFTLGLTLLFVACDTAAFAQSATGEWSPTVNGLQGRLSLSEDPPIHGTRMLAVYLELKNLSDVGNPNEIYFDPIRSLKCDLVDAQNKPISQAAVVASVLTPSPYWLSLPYDGVLRFRVSVYGYGIPEDGGRMVQMSCGAWLVKKDDDREYSFSVSLVAVRQNEETDRRPWTGTLALLKVPIPC